MKSLNKKIEWSPQFHNDIQEDSIKENKRFNPRKGLLSESKLQFKYKPNFAVDESSDSDSSIEKSKN